jgi:uncharacterized protein YqfA (UPF0365 family)
MCRNSLERSSTSVFFCARKTVIFAKNVDQMNRLLAVNFGSSLLVGGLIVVSIFALLCAWAVVRYGALWFQAYLSGAEVRLMSLIGMSFRRVNPRMIVTAQIMGAQAGLNTAAPSGINTARLEGHFLAGGDVMQVIRAMIVAHVAGMKLDFDRAAAIDLAGRDVLDAVRITVSPKVISCPEVQHHGLTRFSGVARNGIELRIRARVTVRTNLDQLIGGATEETIIARIGQGIISTIGRAATHMDVLAMPNGISKSVLDRGLDANTAFQIVSIDIAEIEIGENIGARLQADQAEADTRIARALAEVRRATAIANQQEMKAKIAESRARLVLAEADVPAAMATAFRAGQLYKRSVPKLPAGHLRDRRREQTSPNEIASPRQPRGGKAHPVPPIIRSIPEDE